MRRTADRLRHAVGYELSALILITPLGALVYDKPLADMGLVALISAGLAALWVYLYNLLFDLAMLRLRGSVHKTVPIRVFHAILFEIGMLLLLLPFIIWYLGIGLLEAFLMDVTFAGFYVVWAFTYNWIYDVVFPIPETGKTRKRS